MFLLWYKMYFLHFPLQLPSGFSILKCPFQHSRLNCFFLREGHRTKGAFCFLPSNGRNHSAVGCFNYKIKNSAMTIFLKMKQRVYINKIIHLHCRGCLDFNYERAGDITKPTPLLASYTPTTISVI